MGVGARFWCAVRASRKEVGSPNALERWDEGSAHTACRSDTNFACQEQRADAYADYMG